MLITHGTASSVIQLALVLVIGEYLCRLAHATPGGALVRNPHLSVYSRACCAPSSTQIGYLMSETERLALLTKDGPGVHRDLCHGGCHGPMVMCQLCRADTVVK